MHHPLQVLKHYWGYDGFRPGQAEVIDSILSGHDTLALMPTGGGKSITFQVPALANPGICLVISPLVALMKDQVKNLQKRGILSAFISSEMPHWEILQQLDNCILGDYKFLYISPERISSELFQEKLKTLSRKVNLLVVDEAHCISQWGNDFRRDYRLIADIRDAIPQVQVIAVTASATAAVVADICEQLHFRKGYRIFKTSFERKNLSFVVRKTDNKLKEICHILSAVPRLCSDLQPYSQRGGRICRKVAGGRYFCRIFPCRPGPGSEDRAADELGERIYACAGRYQRIRNGDR